MPSNPYLDPDDRGQSLVTAGDGVTNGATSTAVATNDGFDVVGLTSSVTTAAANSENAISASADTVAEIGTISAARRRPIVPLSDA